MNVSDGGVPKRPLPGARLTRNGVEGDRQRSLNIHGGPERAVCLCARELYDALRAEGHPVEPGSLGENVTVEGLAWAEVKAGRRLKVGEAVLEVTRPASPCKVIRHNFKDGDFSRISEKVHPGESRVYARVIEEGLARPGDVVELLG